jgi:tetratricopeptide (TPR) repeat protein
MQKGSEYRGPVSSGRFSKKKIRIFRIIAILLPLLVLLVLEISLRIFQYGDNLDLFIEAKDRPEFLVLNPAASRRYFINSAFAPTGNSELFRKVKEKSTLRFFVLGESTTIGYPYFHNGAFHRWLLYRLMREFPDRQFEIINLSLTAVNSYTVLGFARELVKYHPDAVLIYSGHNEYYGTLGVASTSRFGSSHAVIKTMILLRRLRIVQLITNLFGGKGLPAEGSNEHHGQTLMQSMVAEQRIPFGSPLYKKGIEQFISNTDETLSLFQKNEIPVFISNLVSNESGIKPFVSIAPDSLRYPGFYKNYGAGIEAMKNGDQPQSIKYLERANQIFSGHALCNYYLGKLALEEGNFEKAKDHFILAKDLDALRFRAPSEINSAIAQLVTKYKVAHLVDTRKAYDSISLHHIIGNELMLEHVHPNLSGYAIMSNCFYEAMKAAGVIPANGEVQVNFEQLKSMMPITAMDSMMGVYRVAKLRQNWPFNEVLSNDDSSVVRSEEARLAWSVINENRRWPDAMDKLYNFYFSKNDLARSATVMESLILEHPTESFFYDKTANLLGKLGNYEEAAFYFKRAFILSPGFEYARTLFVIYLTIDKPNEAMPYLNYAIQHNTSNLNFLPVRKYAGEIIVLQKEISKDSTNIPVLKQIAGSYMNMGNKEGAWKYAEKILKVDPKNKEALVLLGQIKKG